MDYTIKKSDLSHLAYWKGQGEFCSPYWVVAGRNYAALCLGQGAGNGEAQAAAGASAGVAAAAGISPVKAFKGVGQVIGPKPRTVIADGQGGLIQH